MKSFTTPDFWAAYSALTPEAKEQAHKAYQLWLFWVLGVDVMMDSKSAGVMKQWTGI